MSYHLIEMKDGQRVIVASDESRSDLEAFADEYHRETPGHGPLFFFEAEIKPVTFRAVFDGAEADPAPKSRSRAKPESRQHKNHAPEPSGSRSEILGYLAKYPSNSFTAAEIAHELRQDRHLVSAVLWRMKRSGVCAIPERGRFQHKPTNGVTAKEGA